MARLVFTTIGSAGDLFPFLPLARELEERGHRAVFAANPWFGPAVEREGFEFRPIGVHLGPEEYATHPEIFEPARGGFPAIQALMKHFVLPHLPAVVADLRAAVQGADLLLAHPAQLAAPMVAELEALRWITLSVFPGNIPSRERAPQGALLPELPGRLGRLANATSWSVARLAMRQAFDRDLNRIRTGLGLAPARDLFLLSGLRSRRVLVLCPPEYCDPPSDWEGHVSCTGYTLFDTPSAWTEPTALAPFLEERPAPVLVSLGVSVAMAARSFIETATAALDRAGERGLFLVGQESNLPPDASSRHAYFPYVPLSRVLPHVRAAVHPGGFGTAAQVVTAGVPSVVVPRAFDQAYHGGRIEALGLGRTLPWGRFRVDRLARVLADVVGDADLRARCRRFASGLGPSDGVAPTCDAIEAALAGAA